jgi:hypothetical protein
VSVPFESTFAKASVFAKATPDKTADKIGFDWVCFAVVKRPDLFS